MKAWDDYLLKLEQMLGKETVDTWIRPLRVERFDAGNLYLDAKDAFAVQWFNEHIRPRLKTELRAPSGRSIKVHLSFTKAPPNIKKETATTSSYLTDSIDPHKTYNTYLDNPFALSVLKEQADNPIFLYGPHGSGKTHLLMAAAQNAFFVHSETFTEHVVHAMRTSDMDTFRATYRNVNALIIDDIHLIKGRTATQEELFHTFNSLHTRHIPIILSSPLPPSKLTGIEPRLISRFEWGVTVPLFAPSKAVLEQILATFPYPLDDRAQRFLLTSLTSPASLQTALDALLLRAHLTKITQFSLEQTQTLLHDILAAEEKKPLTPKDILNAVADTFEVLTEDILGKSQVRSCVTPRKIAMFLMRHKLKMAYTKIGETFQRDHSTVMTSCRDIEKRLSQLKPTLEQISHILG